MISSKLHRRDDAVSEAEFARSKRNLWIVAVIWMVALVVGVMTVSLLQWYYLAGMGLLLALTMPSPGELFQSYEGYKKKWLREGGASRGEKVAKLG